MLPTRPSILATSALALVVASQPLAWAAVTTLSPAHFDAKRNAVVVPYTGAFPAFTSAGLAGPPRVYFDFNARPAFAGVPKGGFAGSSDLVSWAMARRGAQVRLTLTLRRALRVQAIDDAAHHEVLLVPQSGPAPAATPEAKPSGKPSKAPAHPAAATHTFMQTFGNTDFRYTVGPRPHGARHDQVSVNVGSNGITDFHVHSEPAKGQVAFSIAIQSTPEPVIHAAPKPAKAKPATKAKPKPHVKPKPKATPKPLPTPSPEMLPSPLPTPGAIATEEATPAPLPTPGMEASATPTPLPTPVPTPTPLPSPTPKPAAAAPSNVLSLYGDFPVSVAETAPNLGSSFSASGGLLEGGRWEGHYGILDLLLDVSHHSETVTDNQTNGATSNQRDAYRALAGVGWRFTPLGMDDALGIGYLVRYMSNSTMQSGGGQAVPPPATTGLLTAPTLLYHGPAVYARIDWPLFGPLGLDVHGGVAPFMFDAMPTGGGDLTGMLGYWATPSLYLRFGPVQLTGGYALANYSATNYDYSRSGPEARLDWRF